MTDVAAPARPSTDTAGASAGQPYALPPLPYAYDALEPVIDTETMRVHHDKHHQAYVDKTNAAIAKYPQWAGLPIEEVLSRLPETPEDIRTALRNQGGGHANHAFFWKVMTPGAPAGPSGELKTAIEKSWGDVDAFKKAFEAAGVAHFGSGWVFLVARPRQDFKLEILTLPNQDSVLELPEPTVGLLICDLWEHAYYLKYKQDRPGWLKSWWGVVNWDYVGERLAGARAGKTQL